MMVRETVAPLSIARARLSRIADLQDISLQTESTADTELSLDSYINLFGSKSR